MITVEEQQLQEWLAVDEITFAIPAQSFAISCAISAEEALPVVTEFALRVAFVCGTLSPDQLQEFFGFSRKETDAVIKSLLDERLIQWNEDHLELTNYALARFQDSSDNLPRFFKIQDWSAEVVFDLISFSPAERPTRLRRVRSQIELATRTFDKESRTIQFAEQSFQQNFHHICRKEKAEIYKISEIDAGERFSIPLPCVFQLDLSGQASIRRNIDDESFGSRLEIAEAITDALANQERGDNDELKEFIQVFGDELLHRYVSGETFDLRRYVQDVHLAKICTYVDDRVMPVLGALYLPRNAADLLQRIKAAFAQPELEPQTDTSDVVEGTSAVQAPTLEQVPRHALWCAPRSTLWARARGARDLAQNLNRLLVPEVSEGLTPPTGLRVILPTPRGGGREMLSIYRDQFPRLLGANFTLMGGNLELLVVPDVLVCAMFHFRLAHQPVAVPIGFVSSNPAHIHAASTLLSTRTRGGTNSVVLLQGSDGNEFAAEKELAFLSEEFSLSGAKPDTPTKGGRPRITLRK
jgi:hypothetical protein